MNDGHPRFIVDLEKRQVVRYADSNSLCERLCVIQPSMFLNSRPVDKDRDPQPLL